MQYSREEILVMMNNKRYPLSSQYDPDWILENAMGSHCLWLQEALCQLMDLKPGGRVLDMGCGKAITSIFLAKEFKVKVWATDLWINTSDNWRRICEMGQQEAVFPIRADASNLPFAENYFDAMVSINSLLFYVTDSNYLKEHLIKYVKPGGLIGIIVPGFLQEYEDGLPEAYKEYEKQFDLDKWHTANWWRNLFENTGLVDVLVADSLDDNDGVDLIHKSEQIHNNQEEPFNVVAWNDMTFYRIIARKTSTYRI